MEKIRTDRCNSIEQILRIIERLRSESERFKRFGGCVTVNLLRRTVPQYDPSLPVAAGDGNRRCVDDGRERVLGLLNLVLSLLERDRHSIERIREIARENGKKGGRPKKGESK